MKIYEVLFREPGDTVSTLIKIEADKWDTSPSQDGDWVRLHRVNDKEQTTHTVAGFAPGTVLAIVEKESDA